MPPVNGLAQKARPQSSLLEPEMTLPSFDSPLLGPCEAIQASPILAGEEIPPLSFDPDVFQLDPDPEATASASGDPDWLSEFDPELIDSLRGCVNFVD